MENENDVLEHGATAAYEMFESLGLFIDASVKKQLHNLQEPVMQLSHQLSELQTKQQQSLYEFEFVKKQLEGLSTMKNLLENAAQTNHLLSKQHYDEHVIQPLVRLLFPVLDTIEDVRKCRSDSGEKVDNLSKALWSQLNEFLANFNVTVFKHKINTKFNPQKMNPIKWMPTLNRELGGLVAESMQVGFVMNNQRILRLETVALFKYQPSETESINQNQGAEKC